MALERDAHRSIGGGGGRAPVYLALLGPLQVAVGGRHAEIPHGMPSRVLLVLAAHRGRVLRDGTLLDALWADRVCPSIGALRNAVMRLRDALGDGSWAVARTGDGYRLDPTVVFDLDAFESSDYPSDALALVRGEPFAAAVDLPIMRGAIDRAAEVIAVAEDALGAELVRGADPCSVAVLRALAAARPEREVRWANVIELSRRLGHRAEALRAARRARVALAEFGLRPGHAVLDAEAAVFRDEAAEPAVGRATSVVIDPATVDSGLPETLALSLWATVCGMIGSGRPVAIDVRCA